MPTARTPAKHSTAPKTTHAPTPASAKKPGHHRAAPASPPPSSTQGLVRVPPKAPKTATTPTPQGTTQGGTTTTPGH